MAANSANTPPAAVMLSIAAIAKRDNVARPTVSIHVRKLIASHGLTVTRDGRGRVASVNVAEYDHLRERYGDPSKAQAPPIAPAGHLATLPLDEYPAKPGDSLTEAQRQKAWIDAERARIALAEQKKELIRAAGVAVAVNEAGIEIARIIDRLPIAADDLAAAVGRDGSHGLRTALKALAQRMRVDIAGTLAAIGTAAPEFEQGPQDQTEE